MAWQPVSEERRATLHAGSSAACMFFGLALLTVGMFSDAAASETASIVGLACFGLGAFWAVATTRHLLSVLRPLRAIDSALRAHAEGERRPEALKIDPRWGERAESWTDILEAGPDPVETDLKSVLEAVGSTGASGDLTSVFHAIPLGVIVLDENGLVLRINGAGRVLLGAGLTDQDAVGCPIDQFIDDEEAVTMVREVIDGTHRQAVGRFARGEDNERTYIQLRVRAMRSEQQSASFLVTCEDVTQREIKDEAHSHFLSHATHELRTPLTNIRLYAEEAVEVGEADPETRTRALDVILTETRRLERTVTDMLSASEIEAGRLSLSVGPVRLEGIFDDLQSDFRALAQAKNISLTFELPPKYPVARADREKLTLAVHNLVGNAIKYTPEGGRVDVVVDADDSSLSVAVKDSGIGIAEPDHERVFDRFYRAGDDRVRAVTGTGLGLCLAREVARLHGGDITLVSELDKGSEFTLMVPLAERRRAAA